MPIYKRLLVVVFFLSVILFSEAQGVFSPEVGIIAGPVQFRSDFGERYDNETNFGNSGFGIGVMGFLNYSYRRGRRSPSWRQNFFKEHVKIRGEISWNTSELEHLGEWVEDYRQTQSAEKLRAHKASVSCLNVGFQFEVSPVSIRSFEAFGRGAGLYPYALFGLYYTFYSADVTTDYKNPDPLLLGKIHPSNFYDDWEPGSVKTNSDSTPSAVTGAGLRYKLSRMEDLVLEMRAQYFFSDWVDGLNHQLESNKTNDWLVWLNFGYILYFD